MGKSIDIRQQLKCLIKWRKKKQKQASAVIFIFGISGPNTKVLWVAYKQDKLGLLIPKAVHEYQEIL